ncbi:hypothetical protein GOODEAATRI_023546 [Goodea atripinnis]|uniref:MHC class I antigen n=1 Tax=Goodea atripinnis TaxID=208336 RepID=A0ABV0NQ38_9TELE
MVVTCWVDGAHDGDRLVRKAWNPIITACSIAISDELDQQFLGYNSVLRPRVVGEWVGRDDNDADPLAAEMLHPPFPRAKTKVCWSGENSPARRLVT